ncbi:MAG TPA: hypothetical protein VLE22_20520 [Bryobacteraceae bacterium]|nr:hypothetical protein [Bryobacteraceae bacterium]
MREQFAQKKRSGRFPSTAPQNANDHRSGKGDSNYDIRQTMTTNGVWMLPFGPGQRFLQSQGFAGKLVGRWELSAFHAARTGRATNFSISRSSKDLPDGNSSNQRPDVVPGVSIYPEHQTLDNWFNIAAFAVPAKGTYGSPRFCCACLCLAGAKPVCDGH